MIVGIPKEVKDNEYRVAATPEGVRELVDAEHTVLIEEGAGLGSGLPEDRYKRAGAQFVSSAEDVWRGAHMIQISLRANRWSPAHDSAAGAVTQVRHFLKTVG